MATRVSTKDFHTVAESQISQHQASISSTVPRTPRTSNITQYKQSLNVIPEIQTPIARPVIDSQTLPNLDTPKESAQSLGDLNALVPLTIPKWRVWWFRILFGSIVLAANVGLVVTYFLTHRHLYLLAIIVFMKSKDLISTIAGVIGLTAKASVSAFEPSKVVSQKLIVNLICAYAETPEQIMKTTSSVIQQDLVPHRQVICIILDGKDTDILPYFSEIKYTRRRSYLTWKFTHMPLLITIGYIEGLPVILLRKLLNAGKKDSLILGHDLFNCPRANMPSETQKLRDDLFIRFIPDLLGSQKVGNFDFIFCTDADSVIHKDAVKRLTESLSKNEKAIAACGVLFAEIDVPQVEWTVWHLYQQFQYTFGQYVRRQAEGLWGRVTCLPGCITMIKVRPEMGPAIAEYARVVPNYNIMQHQVQYLGTDRRLTWCILSQGTQLRSIFVPNAFCETVVPNNHHHYLSQRRRWASNAYFNDWYYAFGANQHLITRIFACIDIIRLSLVFYRVINTALFLRSLISRFYILKLTPTLVLTKTPALWFFVFVLCRVPTLSRRGHKLAIGMCINQIMSPILSVIVFADVLLHIGSHVWGKTGVGSSTGSVIVSFPVAQRSPRFTWTPRSLAETVRTAVRDNAKDLSLVNERRAREDAMKAYGKDESATPSKQSACCVSPSSNIRKRISRSPLK